MISFNPSRMNRCDWFLILFVFYYLQGIIYSEGGFISSAILGTILLISTKCAFRVVQMKSKPAYFKGLNLLIVMFTLYGFAYMLLNPSIVKFSSGLSIPSYNYIKEIYLSLLPIYPFYYFSKKGYLTQESLQKWGVVFLISVTLTFFRSQQEALQALIEKGSSTEEITNNSGYLFLSCIPLLVLYRKKPLYQFAGLAYVMAFIVLGMKRGAIGIGGIISMYFILQAIKNSKGNRRLIILILSVAICLGAIYFFGYQMTHSDYMMQRIQDTMDGNTSNRDNIYTFFWNYFTEKSTFIQFLFGVGANGTLEIYSSYAHNDWLEIAVNQGVLGILIYFFYWYSFYYTWKKCSNQKAKIILFLLLIINFLKTLFSMSYADVSYVSACTMGYALAITNQVNIEKNE